MTRDEDQGGGEGLELDPGTDAKGADEIDLGYHGENRAEEIREESAKEEDATGTIVHQRQTFRVAGKTIRHYVAHKEYGVVFSLCGIRTVQKAVEIDPEAVQDEVVCQKCMRHL